MRRVAIDYLVGLLHLPCSRFGLLKARLFRKAGFSYSCLWENESSRKARAMQSGLEKEGHMRTITLGSTGIVTLQNAFGALPISAFPKLMPWRFCAVRIRAA